MPLDEAEEKPKVYGNEGGDTAPSLDIVGDDKADVIRISEDEIPKNEPITSIASTSCPNGARQTVSNHQTGNHTNNGSAFGRTRTAFNTVSPSYFSVYNPHILQYYNGLWGNRFPFASSAAAGLSSPLGSPSYGAPLNGVYPSAAAATWLSPFPFDATKTGFYAPLVMGLPAQVSPNFASPIDQFQLSMMGANFASLSGRMMESPMFQPSPLQSPDTGATIAPIGSKVPQAVPALKLMGSNNGVSASTHGFHLSPSYSQASLASANNPLLSMRQLVVPQPTTSVTSVANNLASNAVKNQENCDQSKSSMGNNGMKRSSTDDVRNRTSSTLSHKQPKESNKKPHIKKPLNAFMLYMKEMRPNVMLEAGLKERQSAEINRILGRRWHSLSREDQQRYYDLARKVRQEHLQKYPGWSARDNYAIHKKKKRKRDKTQEGADSLEAKKCRARFGLDQQMRWCKHCRRKKKCLWFKDGENDSADAAEASPPAQVTSTTSQFLLMDGAKGVDAAALKPESARQPSLAVNGAEQAVNSPNPLVSSTTNGRKQESSSDDDDEDDEDEEEISEDDLIESFSDYDDDVGDDLLESKRRKLHDVDVTTCDADDENKNVVSLQHASLSAKPALKT